MKKSALILFFIAVLSCQKQDDQYTVGNSDGPKLQDIIAYSSVSLHQLEADNITVCTIIAKINPEADSNNRDIAFTTSGGLFTNGDTMQIIHANTDGLALVSLLSDSAQTVRVKASVLTYSIDTNIVFTAALPDDILLNADQYVADTDTDTNINITTQLFRNPGRGNVSDPVKVIYKVVAVDTSVNLIYPDFAYSDDHAADITITNPYKVSGNFNVTSKVISANGDTLSKTISIKIK